MDKTTNQWHESVFIYRLGTKLYTGLVLSYHSVRAGILFLTLLIYESMMCIVEAMLQVANPETDLRRSAVAVRVATIEQRAVTSVPLINTTMRTSKIMALPAPRSVSLTRPHKPEPTILIPEVVPYISVEQTRPLTPVLSSRALSAPVTPIRTPSPESKSNTSSQLSGPITPLPPPKIIEPEPKMSNEEAAKTLEPETPKTPPPTPAAGNDHQQTGPTLAEIFKAFAKFGDCKSDGSSITLSNSDKWFKQAQLFDGKTLTTTDSGIYWKQTAKTKRSLNFSEYLKFLEALAKAKKLELNDLKAKLKSSGPPSTSNATHAQAAGAFGRLTDHTKYTGSHKQRFDESGKGRGKAGREDIIVNTGYVNGFKQ